MSYKKFRLALIIDYISSEYSNAMLEGVRNLCYEKDMELFIFPIGKIGDIQNMFDYQYASVLSFVNSQNIDGVLVAGGVQLQYQTEDEYLCFLERFKPLPVVSISVKAGNYPCVIIDSKFSYDSIIDYVFQKKNVRKVGVLTAKTNSTEVKDRQENITQALIRNSYDVSDIQIWAGDFTYDNAMHNLESYWQKNRDFDIDFLIAINDEMALGALDFCSKNKIKVPEDIVIVGFDDLSRARSASPSLTTINQQVSLQAYAAADKLLKILNNEPYENITVINTKAIFRLSTKLSDYSEVGSSGKGTVIKRNLSLAYNTFATEWYQKKSQLEKISSFFTQMQNDMTIAQLQARINSDIRNFDISAAVVVLFENPIEVFTPFDEFVLPKKANIISVYDDALNFEVFSDYEDLVFNPNETLIPNGIIQIGAEGLFTMSLFHNSSQFGYIVFRRGNFDISIYELFSKILSSIISSVYAYTMVNNESLQHKSEVTRLDEIASTDEMTGLYNRRGLFDMGKELLDLAEKNQSSGLIIYCDMDGLKRINDTYGHESGDEAIVAESNILKKNFRSKDILARLGGDEFVVICPELSIEEYKKIKEKIDEDCKLWTEENKTPYVLSISSGYVEYPAEKIGYQITPLLSTADSGLYIEKMHKKNSRRAMEAKNHS